MQAPVQPKNFAPGAGVAVSVTVVPWVIFAEQIFPQSMAAGSLATVPSLTPLTESVNFGAKLAVTFRDSLTVTVQLS